MTPILARSLFLFSILAAACSREPAATSIPVQALQGPGAPSNLVYATPSAVYRQHRAIPPNVPSFNGTVTSWSVFPALPAGLVLDPASGVIDGRPTLLGRPNTHTVTASNANGSTSAQVSIRVVPYAQEQEPHQNGLASSLHTTGLFYGRLADVYEGVGQERRVVARNLVIGENIQSDGVDFEMETQLVTGVVNVVILHPLGTVDFDDAYDRLQQQLGVLPAVDPAGLPPFPKVPRNAAIVVRFDDVLDSATVGADTLRLVAAAAGELPLLARVDPNHGGLADPDGDGRFAYLPTRVILDPTITPFDQIANPLAPASPVGLPAAETVDIANVVLRIPTLLHAPSGQTRRLQNPAGNGVASSGNGPIDPASPTLDVVRGLRSGGPSTVTGDPFEGFLGDLDPPHVIGRQGGSVVTSTPDVGFGRGRFVIDFAFDALPCARALRAGDVLVAPGNRYAEVVETSGPNVGNLVTGVRVRMLSGFEPSLGSALAWTRYDPIADAGREACFIAFQPQAGLPPNDGVAPDATVRVAFSEAMDAASVSDFDGAFLSRIAPPADARDLMPTQFTIAAAGDVLTIAPVLPLRHVAGTSETVFVHIVGAGGGARDLAGNALALFPTSQFHLSPAAPSSNTDGLVLRFDSTDELGNNGRPEVRGQFLFDLTEGTLRPRPVTHFTATIDRTQPVPSLMAPFGPGVQAPLNPLGCKLQTLWRYCDAGFGLFDEAGHNVDVEGLSWAPVGGAAVADQYVQFEIRLAHSKHLPDESLDAFLQPRFPGSGVESTYANNLLDPVNDPQDVVHPRQLGYTVNPADRYQGASGTFFMPYPLNQGLPAEQHQHYTWRDTAIQTVGAPSDSPGAELLIVQLALGLPQTPGVPYATGQVPTIGLPLLTEFRCFPDTGGLGLNAFDVSLATLSSARPNFRAFSAGGVQGGTTVIKDPDLQNFATGGFNPGSTPPGAATLGVENTFYLGEMQLVTRINRAHTIFLDAGAATTLVAPPVVVPGAAEQPPGTSIQLAFRGATAVSGPAFNVSNDASTVDFYGNARTPSIPPAGGTVTFPGGDRTWKTTAAAVSGARYVQVRLTFVSNAVTNRTPELSALGLAWAL